MTPKYGTMTEVQKASINFKLFSIYFWIKDMLININKDFVLVKVKGILNRVPPEVTSFYSPVMDKPRRRRKPEALRE